MGCYEQAYHLLTYLGLVCLVFFPFLWTSLKKGQTCFLVVHSLNTWRYPQYSTFGLIEMLILFFSNRKILYIWMYNWASVVSQWSITELCLGITASYVHSYIGYINIFILPEYGEKVFVFNVHVLLFNQSTNQRSINIPINQPMQFIIY